MTDQDWRHDRLLDLRGLQCPLPALLVGKALTSMGPGERLLAEATDPMAAIDIPHLCAERGHRVIAQARDGETLRFLIEPGRL